MRAEAYEVYGMGTYVFIYRAEVSRDVDASASLVWVMKRVIIEDRMERFLFENKQTLVRFLPLSPLQFLVSLFEVPMEDNLHAYR